MKENTLKNFFRETYNSSSPIPYIISAQIGVFVLIHLFDLLVDLNLVSIPLYDYAYTKLSLPVQLTSFLRQPWSLVTYPLVYTGLFQIIFSCLWLYWMGNMFLNVLNTRQFWFIYAGSLIFSGILYLSFGQIDFLQRSPQTLLNTSTMALGALMGSLLLISPDMEVRLFLFGNVRIRTIAIVYLLFQTGFYVLTNKTAAVVFILATFFGAFYIKQLKQGRDLSKPIRVKKKSKLKVIYPENELAQHSRRKSRYDLPNQEEVDRILDKISSSGYESLSSQEKEVLFKTSRKQDS